MPNALSTIASTFVKYDYAAVILVTLLLEDQWNLAQLWQIKPFFGHYHAQFWLPRIIDFIN